MILAPYMTFMASSNLVTQLHSVMNMLRVIGNFVAHMVAHLTCFPAEATKNHIFILPKAKLGANSVPTLVKGAKSRVEHLRGLNSCKNTEEEELRSSGEARMNRVFVCKTSLGMS